MFDFTGYTFVDYEGWVGIYKDCKLEAQTSDFLGWLTKKLKLNMDYDSAYNWPDWDDSEFPEYLP